MATSKENRVFILEQLSILDDILCRPMMGEYLLYYRGKLFGGIYDNRLLIKIVSTNQEFNLNEVTPYKGAKSMYQIEDLDHRELLRDIILKTCEGIL